MRIHYLQHAEFEGINCLKSWITQNQHSLTATTLFNIEDSNNDLQHNVFPSLDSFDWLIIMGGPMGVQDEQTYPWLKAEKLFISEVIQANKIVLGICLGAQLIADALGADVSPNAQREIGWYPVHNHPNIQQTFMSGVIPDNIQTFHWHSDRFAIPQNSTPILSSKACDNQGFVYGSRVLALQCHFETDQQFVQHLIQHCGDELSNSNTGKPQTYVQTKNELLGNTQYYQRSQNVMTAILDKMQHC